jgi:hypothetical protein
VEPVGRSIPLCPERHLPHRARGVGIDPTFEGGYRLPGLGVVTGQRPAAEKIMPPGRRPTGGVDPTKSVQEFGQICREPAQIGDTPDARGLGF